MLTKAGLHADSSHGSRLLAALPTASGRLGGGGAHSSPKTPFLLVDSFYETNKTPCRIRT